MNRRILPVILLCIAGSSQAALLGRAPTTPGGTDYQAYYDTVLDMTWLTNANLSATNTFGVSAICADPLPVGCPQPPGAMDWNVAQDWVTAMNAANYLGVNNWRLPNMDRNGDGIVINCLNVSPGILCRDNELGFMRWRNNISTAAPGPFTNIANYFGYGYYWSGTEYVDDPSRSWIMNFGVYVQSPLTKTSNNYVWAVSSGDALAAVPIPAAAWLFGGALGALGWIRRKTEVPVV